MLESLIQNNPTLQELLPGPRHYRNGLYRAASTFVTPLAFGEFEAIAIPIALFFAVHRSSLLERSLGWAVAVGGVIGIFCSGSRGGYVGVLVSVPLFLVIWAIRNGKNNRASLAPAIVGLGGGVSFAAIAVLVMVWKRAHNIVLGGGEQAVSTQARYEQWSAGIPFIKLESDHRAWLHNGWLPYQQLNRQLFPVAYHGDGSARPFIFQRVACASDLVRSAEYLSDMSESGAVAGALACSFVAFFSNQLVLSQRENHMLIFSLLAIVVVMNYEYTRKQVPYRTASQRV